MNVRLIQARLGVTLLTLTLFTATIVITAKVTTWYVKVKTEVSAAIAFEADQVIFDEACAPGSGQYLTHRGKVYTCKFVRDMTEEDFADQEKQKSERPLLFPSDKGMLRKSAFIL